VQYGPIVSSGARIFSNLGARVGNGQAVRRRAAMAMLGGERGYGELKRTASSMRSTEQRLQRFLGFGGGGTKFLLLSTDKKGKRACTPGRETGAIKMNLTLKRLRKQVSKEGARLTPPRTFYGGMRGHWSSCMRHSTALSNPEKRQR